MRQTLLAGIAFVCASLSLQVMAEGVELWTVEKALVELGSRNLSLQEARVEMDRAAAKQQEAFSVYFPQGELSGEFFSGPGFKGGPLGGGLDYGNAGVVARTRLQLGLLVFAFGQANALNDLAETYRDLKGLEYKVAQESLFRAVRADFRIGALAVQLERDLLAVSQAIDLRMQNQATGTESNRITLLGLDSRLAAWLGKARTLKGSAERRILKAVDDVRGEVDFESIELPGATTTTVIGVEKCIANAMEDRAELAAATKALTLARDYASFERLRFLPGFALVGGYGRRYAGGDDNQTGAFRRDPRNGGGPSLVLASEWELKPVERWEALSKADMQWKKGEKELAMGLEYALYQIERTRMGVLRGQGEVRAALAAGELHQEFEQALLAKQSLERFTSESISGWVKARTQRFEADLVFLKSVRHFRAASSARCIFEGAN